MDKKQVLENIYDTVGGDVMVACEYVRLNLYPKSINKPNKPTLKTGADSKEVLAYAKELEIYEDAMAQYKVDEAFRKEEIDKINNALMRYIEDESNLRSIPEQYRANVRFLAWKEGHSSGYYEYYNWLCKLVDLFNV